MPPITSGMGGMSTGPSTSFMSRLGQMAPGMLGGMAGMFGDPEISGGSGMPLNKMIGRQRPRNMGGMTPPVQGPQLVQPPTNMPGMGMPNIAPGMTPMGPDTSMGPNMPVSVPGSFQDMGGMSRNGQNNRFSMPSNNSGFTGGMNNPKLWDIYSQLLNGGMGMGMM